MPPHIRLGVKPQRLRLRTRPRPIRHAHRVRRGGHPGTARLQLLASLAAVVLAVATLQSGQGGEGGAVGAAHPPTDGPAAGTSSAALEAPVERTPAPVAAAATLGPHGDLVTGGDVAEPDIPRRIRQVGRTPVPPRPELLSGYRWPVQNARITNSFGPGRPGSFRQDGAPFHDGIDLSSFCGARITAAHDGIVLAAGRRHHEFQGWVGDLGPFRARLDATAGWRSQAIVVVIDDGNGYRSVYAHLGLAAVTPGETVRAGDLIGWEGASGNATGCHLHFAIFSPLEQDTVALDPRIVRTSKLPPAQVARIDPLLVLPPPAEAGVTWGWGAR